ncbi:hypothetical protein GCM10020331_076660 [Ectobacillus funiculus]
MKTIGYIPTFRDIKGVPKFHSKKQGKFSYTTNQTNGNIKKYGKKTESVSYVFRNSKKEFL